MSTHLCVLDIMILFWDCSIVFHMKLSYLKCPIMSNISRTNYLLVICVCVLILHYNGKFLFMSIEILALTVSGDYFSSGNSMQLDVRAILQLFLLCTLDILWSLNFLFWKLGHLVQFSNFVMSNSLRPHEP